MQSQKKKSKILGSRIYHLSLVDSTNKIAFSLAERGEEEGTVVLADRQLNGEGRRGREWFSPLGGLWFSLILRPPCLPECTSIYPLMGAVALAETIRKIFPSCPACICWPNDTVVRGKKIGGVMCKIRVEGEKLKFVIMGIGVNLNIKSFPPFLENVATSLFLETHRLVSPLSFLNPLLDTLEELYLLSQIHHSLILKRAQKLFPFAGKPMRLITSGEDKRVWVMGIDLEGNLVVQIENGIKRVVTPEESCSLESW